MTLSNRLKGLWILLGIILFIYPFLLGAHEEHGETDEPVIFMLGRDDCGFCRAEKEFLDEEGLHYEYLNIIEDEYAAELYDAVIEKHGLSRVTPITVIGEQVFLGWNSERTTGVAFKAALKAAESSEVRTVEDHLAFAPSQTVSSEGGCSGVGCEAGDAVLYIFDLPFIGLVDLKSLSLFTLSALLGTIDGFNPCAMWVLITFLVLLSQAGSRKKMVFLAGIFIFAEAVMYNLILNVWYQTWDFVALDQIVTPLVGFLAFGGGLFFLWRWHKNKNQPLVCDITDIESQSKTIGKLQAVIHQPLTLATIGAILIIAFSVNIIEFACSIGIPQAFTKILELNGLSFLERQWYILIYTFGYMLDDLVVFGLAIWGYSRLEAHGAKYSQLSLLIGGVLMAVLGAILIINPMWLVL